MHLTLNTNAQECTFAQPSCDMHATGDRSRTRKELDGETTMMRATMALDDVRLARRRGTWLYVRVVHVSMEKKRKRVLVEKCLGRDGLWLDTQRPIACDLQRVKQTDAIYIELWESNDEDDTFLHPVGTSTLQCGQWRADQPSTRWYCLRTLSSGRNAWTESSFDGDFTENALENAMDGVGYVKLSVHFVPEPGLQQSTTADGFHFVYPRQRLRKATRLRELRVGQVVHDRQASVLQELLPDTLYGRVPTSSDGQTPSRPDQALILLQLACQYALHTTTQLQDHVRLLEHNNSAMKATIQRRRQKTGELARRKANLARELEVLDCSVDGMRMLLQEMDPSRLADLEPKGDEASQ